MAPGKEGRAVSYDALVITAHPDDAETQMGGTLAKLADRGQRILLVDLTEGEPSDFAASGERARQAAEAARVLGVERLTLPHQDRFLVDTPEVRLEVAALIREHRPPVVYAIGDACVHPDHVAAAGIARAAVFLARLGRWDQVPGGQRLAAQAPWAVDRLFLRTARWKGPGRSSPSARHTLTRQAPGGVRLGLRRPVRLPGIRAAEGGAGPQDGCRRLS